MIFWAWTMDGFCPALKKPPACTCLKVFIMKQIKREPLEVSHLLATLAAIVARVVNGENQK